MARWQRHRYCSRRRAASKLRRRVANSPRARRYRGSKDHVPARRTTSRRLRVVSSRVKGLTLRPNSPVAAKRISESNAAGLRSRSSASRRAGLELKINAATAARVGALAAQLPRFKLTRLAAAMSPARQTHRAQQRRTAQRRRVAYMQSTSTRGTCVCAAAAAKEPMTHKTETGRLLQQGVSVGHPPPPDGCRATTSRAALVLGWQVLERSSASSYRSNSLTDATCARFGAPAGERGVPPGITQRSCACRQGRREAVIRQRSSAVASASAGRADRAAAGMPIFAAPATDGRLYASALVVASYQSAAAPRRRCRSLSVIQ